MALLGYALIELVVRRRFCLWVALAQPDIGHLLVDECEDVYLATTLGTSRFYTAPAAGRPPPMPEFFKDEDELRAIWSAPDTRRKLLEGLAEKGFGKDNLSEMRVIIEAENSDLFDVLAFVAYAETPLTREERAERAKVVIGTQFNDKQQAFLTFVLAHYVSTGERASHEQTAPSRGRRHPMLSTLAYSPCEPYGKRVKWRSLSH